MTRFLIAVLGALAMSCGLARAQLVLPGAAARTPPGAPAEAPAPRKPEKAAAVFASSVAAVVGRPLQLNGDQGQLLFSGRGKVLRIDKFSLPGEVISDPSRKCLIDIVGEAPIETKSLGRPDGLARYEAEIPACPFPSTWSRARRWFPRRTRPAFFRRPIARRAPPDFGAPRGPVWKTTQNRSSGNGRAPTRRRRKACARSRRGSKVARRPQTSRGETTIFPRDATTYAAITRRKLLHGYCASRMAQARAALLQERIEALEQRAAGQD